jgi:hypothetical protein
VRACTREGVRARKRLVRASERLTVVSLTAICAWNLMLMCSNSPMVCTDPLSGQCAGASIAPNRRRADSPPRRLAVLCLAWFGLVWVGLCLAWLERVLAKKSAEAQAHLERRHHRDGRQEAAGQEGEANGSSAQRVWALPCEVWRHHSMHTQYCE